MKRRCNVAQSSGIPTLHSSKHTPRCRHTNPCAPIPSSRQRHHLACACGSHVPPMTAASRRSPRRGSTSAMPPRTMAPWTAMFSATIPMAAQAPHCTLVAGRPASVRGPGNKLVRVTSNHSTTTEALDCRQYHHTLLARASLCSVMPSQLPVSLSCCHLCLPCWGLQHPASHWLLHSSRCQPDQSAMPPS